MLLCIASLVGKRRLGDQFAGPPALDDDGTIYIPLHHTGSVLALNRDGSKKWRFPTGSVIWNAGPVIGPDGTIYLGSLGKKFYAINPDGRKKWEFAVDAEVRSTAAIDQQGAIYFSTIDFSTMNEKVYCLNPDGTEKWALSSGWTSPLISANGVVYVGSYKGLLTAIKAGSPLASSPWPGFAHDAQHSGVAGGKVALRVTQQPQSITVAEGSSASFSVTAGAEAPLSYQWRLNGADIAGATNSTLFLRVARAADGGVYQVLIRNANGSSISAGATLNVLAPRSFVERHLPVNYYAGNTMRVTLSATPPDSATVYAVQDQPPAEWTIGAISDGGSYDAANHRIKFGPFFDHEPRELSYEVTPPFLTQGSASAFSGQGSAEGVSSLILGDNLVDLVGLLHPADSLVIDNRISIDEVTTYASAWRRGELWPIAPNPIPIEFVTRAGALWKDGEEYVYDPSMATPVLRWINRSGPASSGLQSLNSTLSVMDEPVGTAVSELREYFVPGQMLTIEVNITPASAVEAYAIQDQLPPGWTASEISDGGEFDSSSQQVKWGPFFDNRRRRLRYTARPPSSSAGPVVFRGVASLNGVNIMVTGSRQMRATARLSISMANRNGLLTLQVQGEAGVDYVLEGSGDLRQWRTLASLTSGNGTAIFAEPISENVFERFYRVRAP